jgi:hypothetical protein
MPSTNWANSGSASTSGCQARPSWARLYWWRGLMVAPGSSWPVLGSLSNGFFYRPITPYLAILNARTMLVGFRKLTGASRTGELPRTQRFRAALQRRRQRLDGAVVESTARLLPLIALLDALQAPPTQESIFRTWRKKLRAHWDDAYAELQAGHSRHRALASALQTFADLLREEARDISPEEWQRAARELALATLKNAPGLISAAQQARLLA